MGQDSQNDDPSSGGAPSWRWMELAFGSGVLIWVITSSLTAIWWASDLSTRVQVLESNDTAFDHRIGSLDNAALGNRITVMETQYRAMNEDVGKIDGKMDKLLELTLDARAANRRGDRPTQ